MSLFQQGSQLQKRITTALSQRIYSIVFCGLSPRKLAITLCIGTAVCIIPLFWGTSLICLFISRVFRLNHIVMQSINYLLWPIQIGLVFPFYKLGASLSPREIKMSSNSIFALLNSPELFSPNLLIHITSHALLGWFVITAPAGLVVYFILRIAFPGIFIHNRMI